MAMLGPMYNHLGRSPKKKRKKSQAQIAAEAEHAKFLRKHGIDPTVKRRRLKGAVPLAEASTYDTSRTPPTSDVIPGNAPAKHDVALMRQRGEEDEATLKAIEQKAKQIAQPYNKGPLMYTTDRETLKTNMRRPTE